MKKVAGILFALGMVAMSYGAITVSLVGDGDGYDESGVNAFRSTGLVKGFDLNSDNVYGSHGLFFFGDGLPDDASGEPYTCHTQVGAAWATFSQGGNFSGVAEGGTFSYAIIDDPTAIPVSVVNEWGIRSAVATATTPASAGSWCEILKFDIDATTPSQFRIGIMAGNANNTNWNPSGISVSVNGFAPVAVTNLSGTVGQANFVFFDVNLNGETSGAFSISAQRRAATQGASIAGVTFDGTSSVVWPGGALRMENPSLSLTLNAPDTSVVGSINALYVFGPSQSEVKIVSAVADAGFSASVGSTLLGPVNQSTAIAITFDNSSIGLANGKSTNSTLVVNWTEVGSGVTNSSKAALSATYVNVPNSLVLAPSSLALTLNAVNASTNGIIRASFVAGTVPANVNVVSVTAGSGFSAAPGTFTLDTINTFKDITVTFANPGGLSHNDVVNSTLAVTWTVAGSGVTNTANAALSVTYNDPPQNLTEKWTIGIDFGATAPVGDTVFNQISVGGSATNLGLAANGVVGLASLVDIDNAPVAGVGFSLSNATGQIAWDFSNATTEGAGLMTDVSVHGDALISNSASGRTLPAGAKFVLTFTGLDDSLFYDLTGGWDHNNLNFNATWAADGQSVVSSPTNSVVGAGYVTLTGLSTDGNGNLVITVTKLNNHVTVGGLTLTAFSQGPATQPVISSSVSGGSLIMSWVGGGTYNVLTNVDLVYGQWGVAVPGAVSPVTNAIGNASQIFYKLSQ